MEKDFKELLKITEEEKNKIINNSPKVLPLNPTAQGFSGTEVRKKMYMALVGEEGSILSLLNERLITLGEYFNDINAGGAGSDDKTYVGPDEPSGNFFTKWIKTTGDGVDVEIIKENSIEAEFEEIETKPILDEIESGELTDDTDNEIETAPMLDEIETEPMLDEIEIEPMLDEIETRPMLDEDEIETEPTLDEIESGELKGDEIITPPQFE